MKLNTTDFGRKMQHPLLLAFASVPVALIIILNFAPDMLRRMWLFPAVYVLLGWSCILIPGKKRILGGVAGAVLLAGMAMTLFAGVGQIALALLPLMYIVLLVVTLPIGGWERNQELATGWHVAAIGTHVVLQMLVNGSRLLANGVYDAAQKPLLASFLCCVVLVLLALNRASLDSAAQSRRRVPLLMRRQNLLITLALLAVGIVIAAIPAIGSVLASLWENVLQGVAWLVELLSALLPQSSSSAGGSAVPADMELGLGEANPPSDLAVLLEKVIGVVALIVVVVAMILVIRVAGKKLAKLLKQLWGRLGQYGAAAGEDYEDEITDTRDESDTEREGLLTRLRRDVPTEEKGLTPVQQVRSRYRHLKQRRKWAAASTARENLPETAAALYERARYGGQELSAEEAESFRAGTKKL